MKWVGVKRLLLAGSAICFGASASAYEVGSFYECPSVGNAPSVGLWVGRIDQEADLEVVSAALWPLSGFDGPPVGHTPFDAAALVNCKSVEPLWERVDRNGFEDGYSVWWAAFENGEAGVWSVPPSKAYGAMLGVLDQ